MRFDMKLDDRSFLSVQNGTKTVEMRLNDEKRRKIGIGDMIFFHRLSDEYDVVKCIVRDLRVYKDFVSLYREYSKEEIGYEEDETADPGDMYHYYDEEQVKRYGVLAILIEKTDDPYLCDGHMHLEYGPLSTGYVMEFVDQAARKGLDEIDILDHSHRFIEFRECYRSLRRYDEQDIWLNRESKFCNSLDEYRKLIKQMKEYDLPVRVKFGLEVCYTSENEKLLRQILKDNGLDFVTGAVHSVFDVLYDMPFSGKLLWDRRDRDEIYRKYYDEVLSLIRSGLFDRLAHPDQPKLFDILPSYDMKDTYEAIAYELNHRNMYAENNTGIHYRYGHRDIGISDEMLKIFGKEKVRMITASDAHKPEDVGSFIREAAERNREVRQ